MRSVVHSANPISSRTLSKTISWLLLFSGTYHVDVELLSTNLGKVCYFVIQGLVWKRYSTEVGRKTLMFWTDENAEVGGVLPMNVSYSPLLLLSSDFIMFTNAACVDFGVLMAFLICVLNWFVGAMLIKKVYLLYFCKWNGTFRASVRSERFESVSVTVSVRSFRCPSLESRHSCITYAWSHKNIATNFLPFHFMIHNNNFLLMYCVGSANSELALAEQGKGQFGEPEPNNYFCPTLATVG